MFVPGVGEDGYYSPASEASFSGTSSPDGDKYTETTSNPLVDHYNLVSPHCHGSLQQPHLCCSTGSRKHVVESLLALPRLVSDQASSARLHCSTQGQGLLPLEP